MPRNPKKLTKASSSCELATITSSFCLILADSATARAFSFEVAANLSAHEDISYKKRVKKVEKREQTWVKWPSSAVLQAPSMKAMSKGGGRLARIFLYSETSLSDNRKKRERS